ncbi:MAG TPA: nitroreductase family protein [Chthonomonadales bacterium]|nr:nitroreductase family protein [Chthonomonadales bacterium]
MDAIEAIMTRRSVRAYTDGTVSHEAIDRLLQCAMHAPSAGNQQPWHFVVLTDRQKMVEAAGLHPYARMTQTAALAVLVCGDTAGLKHPLYWQQDCAAAVQNLLVAAHAMGLGAVWTGIYPTEDRVKAFQQWLGLPEHILPLALIPIGYPEQEPAQVERYEPRRVHMNGW